jgi:hypothetical protein
MNNPIQETKKSAQSKFITVVSGLPRSGTSMAMKMLEAGGMAPVTDNLRTADLDNPKGYYEFERVKKMPEGDTAWLAEANGKAVKVISALLEYLPDGYFYRVLFMRRKMEEILASQQQMLIRADKPTDQVNDQQLAMIYTKHLSSIQSWLSKKPNFSVLYLDYNLLLTDPSKYASEINHFVDGRLDVENMLKAVDPSLYRQRK